MEIKIQAIRFDATEALENFVQKKLEKLGRKNPEILLAEVNLKVVKPESAKNKEAIISIKYPQAADVVVSKTADTFEEAIDLGVAALEPQLEKLKARK
ncbi:MAG: ribosome-associated translation inhibitor RaiA [Muribaculaceae bacterium]|nr:ribosome-associated translation inhibitor RaiA [Muribaculaceae bacterium]MDE7110802.1 ribosome-associated translation inhibitor RaiA [Muribaculaceae bacterium]